MTRAFFVLTPAVASGLLFGILLHPVAGCIVAVAMTAIGIGATKARFERGEGDHDRLS